MSDTTDAAPLPDPGYTELLGVPVDTIEALGQLRKAAYAYTLSLTDWRNTHTHLVANTKAADRDHLVAMRGATAHAWADAPAHRRDHLDRLLRHLDDLWPPPPTAEDLAAALAGGFDARRARVRDLIPDPARALADIDAEEGLYRAWSVDPDAAPAAADLDPVSGLPEDLVAAHRTTTHPALGTVPVGWVEAREAAWRAATDAQRDIAEAATGQRWRPADPDTRRMRQLQLELTRGVLTDFLAWAYTATGPVADQIRAGWDSGELPALLGRYLDERD